MTDIPDETKEAMEIAKKYAVGNPNETVRRISPSKFMVQFPSTMLNKSQQEKLPKKLLQKYEELNMEIEEIKHTDNPKYVFTHTSAP